MEKFSHTRPMFDIAELLPLTEFSPNLGPLHVVRAKSLSKIQEDIAYHGDSALHNSIAVQ